MPNLNGAIGSILNSTFSGISSWFGKINPLSGNDIELKVGIDFFELGIRVIAIKAVNNDWNKVRVNFNECVPLDTQLLANSINRIIAQNPQYKVSLIANLATKNTLNKIVTIDKALSEAEVHRFFKQKLGRLKRFSCCEFAMQYAKVSNGNELHAGHHSYYLVACEKSEVDKLKSDLSSIPVNNKKLDVSSLALLRVASAAQLNIGLLDVARWMCHITDHEITIVGESNNGHPYEKVYPLNLPLSSSSDSAVESEFSYSNLAYRNEVSEQVINTLSQVFLRAQFNREFVLLISSMFVWDVPAKAMLMEIPSLSLAHVYFVNLNLTQDTNLSCSNPNSPKLALNNEYIVALGLALKGVELTRFNKSKIDSQLTNLGHFIEVNQCNSQSKKTLENNTQSRQSPLGKVEHLYD